MDKSLTETNKKPYVPPQVILELALETRAGTPI
jgi:hypothetical protein